MTKSFENFKNVIESLQAQHRKDVEYSKHIEWISGSEDVSIYDHSLLLESVILLIAGWFEDTHKAISDIKEFFFLLDYGEKSHLDNPIENLWEILNGEGIRKCDCFLNNDTCKCETS